MTIGVLLPSDPMEATAMRRGVELAIAQNSTPTQKIRAVMRERSSQWGADGQEAAEMVLDEGAAGIIAPSDGATAHLALQVSGRTAVPVVLLCSDDSVLGAQIPWAIRIVPGTREQARTILTNAPAQRWCAVVPSDRAGKEATRDLRAAAESARRPLHVVSFTNSAQAADAARAAAADGVLIWLAHRPSLDATTRSLRSSGFHGVIAAPCTTSVTNGIFTAPPALTNQAAAAFQSNYVRRFGEAPTYTAALAHDAALLMAELGRVSLKRGPNAAQRQVAQIRRYGASGWLEFDASGNRVIPLNCLPAAPISTRKDLISP